MDFSHKCDRCGDCCRTQKIPFNILDIFSASAHLSIKPCDFTVTYLELGKDKDGEKVYLVKDKPCPFLKDNQCSIETAKPTACKTAPCPKNEEYAHFIKKYGLVTLQFLENSPDDMIRHFLNVESTGDYLSSHKKFNEKSALKNKEKTEKELHDIKQVARLLENIVMIAAHPEYRAIITAKIRGDSA